MAGGRGCGARGQASQAYLREVPGRRPPLLRGAAFTGWTRRGRRRAKACRIGGPAGPRPRPEVTAPGTEKPLWSAERRPHPSKEDAARRKTGAPLGAPPPRCFEGHEEGPAPAGRTTAYPAPVKNTGDDAWLVAPKRSEGGLFEN